MTPRVKSRGRVKRSDRPEEGASKQPGRERKKSRNPMANYLR